MSINPKPKIVRTRSQQVAQEVKGMILARNPIIWIQSREEPRVEQYLIEAIGAAGRLCYTWDIGEGVTTDPTKPPQANLAPLPAVFGEILKAATIPPPPAGTPPEADPRKRIVWIMRDLPPWIIGSARAVELRKLRNLARRLPTTPQEVAQTIIVLTPHGDIPPELTDHTTFLKWPLPSREEIASSFDAALAVQNPPLSVARAAREAAIDAAVGLTGEEAMSCFAKTMSRRRVDPKLVAGEKKRIVERNGLIQWYDPIPGGLDAIGGLDIVKTWLNKRKVAFEEDAKKAGLQAPKGVLATGISGCGKTMLAKASATAWDQPLLRVDLGSIKNSLVGSSENRLRSALDTIDAIGRCTVWFDEVEKMFQGATSGAKDSGVSSDQLGTILNWMQEHKSEAFVFMTANDIQAILDNAPELLRKGRLDEIFFVDLPNAAERAEILQVTLRKFKRDGLKIDLRKIAAATEKFTGSEIAALVEDAMFVAYADGKRDIKTSDLIDIAKTVVPLSKSAGPKIDALRKWADAGNAKRATSPVSTGVSRVERHEVRQVEYAEEEEGDE